VDVEAARPVEYREEAGVAWITLNRPSRLNAFTAELAKELMAALLAAEAPEVRAVVLTGAGRAFCSGSDLGVNFGEDQPPPEVTLRQARHPIFFAIRSLPKPVVCAVNGVAAGIGLALALSGDLVVAKESAIFNVAFTRLGLGPDGGTSWLLAQSIGRARALRLLMLGEQIDARTAFDWGLATAWFPDAEFEQGVTELAARLASGPTRAFAQAKVACDSAVHSGHAQHLELEARLQGEVARSDDFAEGLAAFLDHRAPTFTGR
jgi:2-(1,2-epoxy-1,2-dihydrophenyl)acetyl-CoA isomerase